MAHVEEACGGDTGPGRDICPGYTFVTMKSINLWRKTCPSGTLNSGASHPGQSTAFLDTDTCSVPDALHPNSGAEILTHLLFIKKYTFPVLFVCISHLNTCYMLLTALCDLWHYSFSLLRHPSASLPTISSPSLKAPEVRDQDTQNITSVDFSTAHYQPTGCGI